jgi:hypothetical protein
MKLPDDIKLKIQCFVYFLFKGTLDPRLITAEFNYLEKLLSNPDTLYNCFEIFVYASRNNSLDNPDQIVTNYILSVHKKGDKAFSVLADQAKEFNSKQSISYWTDFLVLAKWFCYNSFPKPLIENYLKGLDGCGTDAVPAFAIWTNLIEIDEHSKPINSDQALTRANERIKTWDNVQPSVKFEEWELEQEIY